MATRQERWSSFQRLFVLIAVVLSFAIPAMDKLPGPYSPQWFAKKFGGTVLGAVYGALASSFGPRRLKR